MSSVFVFPGQGSQSLGMLAELGAHHPVVCATFNSASEALGYDLWKLSQEGPEADLNQTDKTQPAMLAAGVAVWRVWQEQSPHRPAFMAGHSLGEYTALVCAGALAFEDAVTLVRDRGQYMQEAVPAGSGAMAAILGLDDAQVRAVCEAAAEGQILSPVNFNSPGQVVVAGHAEAVDRAVVAAKDAGARRALKLAVSVPSHCALMKPAAERLRARLADLDIASPGIPMLHNVDCESHAEPEAIRSALVSQLHQPVRWVETVRALAGQGVDTLMECGPGKVLTGLNKRIDRGMSAMPLLDADSLAKALEVYA